MSTSGRMKVCLDGKLKVCNDGKLMVDCRQGTCLCADSYWKVYFSPAACHCNSLAYTILMHPGWDTSCRFWFTGLHSSCNSGNADAMLTYDRVSDMWSLMLQAGEYPCFVGTCAGTNFACMGTNLFDGGSQYGQLTIRYCNPNNGCQ